LRAPPLSAVELDVEQPEGERVVMECPAVDGEGQDAPGGLPPATLASARAGGRRFGLRRLLPPLLCRFGHRRAPALQRPSR
jgi:hypothetical protein